MLTDNERTELLNLLAAWERLTEGKNAADLDGEQDVIFGMVAVDTRINELCPPATNPLPWSYTPLDTVRPDMEAEGGIA